jgi:hypothetical protein
MKYLIIRCLCYKGETLAQSINAKCKEFAGEFNDEKSAAKYKEKLDKQELLRIKSERKNKTWNGNEFVFWIEKQEGKDDSDNTTTVS